MDFFSKHDQIRSKLRIWSHSLKKSLMENFIFCAVDVAKIVVSRFSNLSVREYDDIIFNYRNFFASSYFFRKKGLSYFPKTFIVI